MKFWAFVEERLLQKVISPEELEKYLSGGYCPL